MLIPTITWTLFVNYLFFSNKFHLPTMKDVVICFSDNGHLWFLTTLFYLMLVTGLYRWAMGKGKTLLSFAILLMAFGIFATIYANFGTLKKCTLYSPYFFAGLLVSSYPILESFIRNKYVNAVALIIFCCMSGYWVSGQTSAFNVIVRLVSAVTAIITIYNIVNRAQWNSYVDKFIRLIGVNTLSIYVAHWYFLDTVDVSQNWALALMQLFAYSILISLVCIGIDKLLSQLKVFRLIFYGKMK